MRFLLTNDDGIDAAGLVACAEILSEFGSVAVVAPGREYSGCSHQVTVDRPLRLVERKPHWWTLDCTPADCVRVALVHLKLDVDWVVAGINPGGNLGADIFMSGTVAAAREAALWKRPAVAFSQYRRSRLPVDWRRAARWTRLVLATLLAEPGSANSAGFWNANFPDPSSDDTGADPPLERCDPDLNPLAVRYEVIAGEDLGEHLAYRGRYQDRPRTAGRDVDRCFSGAITLSHIGLA